MPDPLDTAPARSYHPTMPIWRCPHCGTPQPETARCWVCHRSSTSCATCRNFRLAVAANLGYCGLGKSATPLRGDEIRPCWEGAAESAADDDLVPEPSPTGEPILHRLSPPADFRLFPDSDF